LHSRDLPRSRDLARQAGSMRELARPDTKVPSSGPVQLKSCCAKTPGAGFNWPSTHPRAMVRRTQLTGSLAGSPDCQIHSSFSGHAAKKGQDRHPNKGGKPTD
jgi:hypothetical protein